MLPDSLRNVKIGTKVSAAMLLTVGGLFGLFVTLTNVWNRAQAEADAMLNVTDRSALLQTTVEVLDKSLREQVLTYAKVSGNGSTAHFRSSRRKGWTSRVKTSLS